MTLHRITIPCLTLALLATACDKKEDTPDDGADQGETDTEGEAEAAGDGDGDNDNDETGYGGNCGEELVSLIDDLDAALPGFDGSVTDHLALLEGTFLGEFSWWPEDGPVSNEHAGTTSLLTVTVTYDGGEIRLTEVELVGQPPEGGIEIGTCSNVLSIDVTLGFATDDGLFAEAFEIPLRVYSHSDNALSSFYFSVDMAALQGQLSLDDFSFTDGVVSDVVMVGDLDGDTVSGGLNIEVMTMDVVGFGGIADFEATRMP